MADRLTELYDAVGPLKPNPWMSGGTYRSDVSLLKRLVQVQVDNGKADNAQTGGVAAAVDVWVACELRRAGFHPDIVWPREQQPRILPQPLGRAVGKFKFARAKATADIQRQTIDKLVASAGNSRSTIIGGQFPKEVDVVIAGEDRGLEFAVSTKAMTDSFGKNISNRWEEASGDLLNIRRRFPLAAFGFAFIATDWVVDEANSFARMKDMLRKLSTVVDAAEGTAYDATCLILANWDSGKAKMSPSFVPDDLSPDRFFTKLIPAVFARSPVGDHREARELWLASNPPNAPL